MGSQSQLALLELVKKWDAVEEIEKGLDWIGFRIDTTFWLKIKIKKYRKIFPYSLLLFLHNLVWK